MNLTKAQIKTLKAVGEGAVVWYEPFYVRQTGYASGARKDVLRRLQELNLIVLPNMRAGDHKPYKLTELGQQVLEAQCKSN